MFTKAAALAAVAVVALAAAPSVARAEGNTCGAPTVIVPDGRITQSTIPDGSSYFFRISSRAGNSYSAEFHNVLGAAVQTPGTLGVFSDAGTCAAAVVTTNAANTDPGDLNGNRVTFTATTTATLFSLTNNSGGTITYSFTVSDTTMFSPAWSTNGTFNSFYSFLNTTGTALAGTLTLYDTTGAAVGTTTFATINPNSTANTNTAALGTIRNKSGTAKFVHNGPPGAILAEAAIANFTITPTPYFQGVKFQPARESTH